MGKLRPRCGILLHQEEASTILHIPLEVRCDRDILKRAFICWRDDKNVNSSSTTYCYAGKGMLRFYESVAAISLATPRHTVPPNGFSVTNTERSLPTTFDWGRNMDQKLRERSPARDLSLFWGRPYLQSCGLFWASEATSIDQHTRGGDQETRPPHQVGPTRSSSLSASPVSLPVRTRYCRIGDVAAVGWVLGGFVGRWSTFDVSDIKFRPKG